MKFLVGFIVVICVLGVLRAMIDGSSSQPSVNPSPVPVATVPAAPVSPQQAAKNQAAAQQQAAKNQIAARQGYSNELESSLLSRGLDAHVTVVGPGKDTLRISWAAMSRPVVYNMINSEGTQKQIPSLGFKKIIFTDDGSFSGTSKESWTFKWDGHQWHQ